MECFGKEASKQAALYFEATEDKTVWLEADPTQGDRDKYQRLLRYVFTDDGVMDFGSTRIALGYASEYTYTTPYKYQDIYQQAEKKAREAKKGLWADNVCTPTNALSPSPTPTQAYSTPVQASIAPVVNTNTTTFTCDCNKTCEVMSSCSEAQYQLHSCGCSQRDMDDDGIACDSDCQ